MQKECEPKGGSLYRATTALHDFVRRAEFGHQLFERLLESMPTPRVTIVTPTYNMAEFLEETIQSVLAQDYPEIEYIVMDACSTDNTGEILERYKDKLTYISAPDRGAADAINRGFSQSTGEVLAWLSADDTYLPCAITKAVHALGSDPTISAVYGQAWLVDRAGTRLRRYPTQPADHLTHECCICQPACFMRRSAFEAVGKLDVNLQVAFDYDLWMRLPGKLVGLDDYVATSRMHGGGKTLRMRKMVYKESIHALSRHYGYVPFRWIHSYACYLVDRRDQFYAPLRPSISKFALSLPIGLWLNRNQMGRYWKEYRAVMTWEGFVRRWTGSRLGHTLQNRRK
jgi:glycosyltransferase involved in cell wall biosynthesis